MNIVCHLCHQKRFSSRGYNRLQTLPLHATRTTKKRREASATARSATDGARPATSFSKAEASAAIRFSRAQSSAKDTPTPLCAASSHLQHQLRAHQPTRRKRKQLRYLHPSARRQILLVLRRPTATSPPPTQDCWSRMLHSMPKSIYSPRMSTSFMNNCEQPNPQPIPTVRSTNIRLRANKMRTRLARTRQWPKMPKTAPLNPRPIPSSHNTPNRPSKPTLNTLSTHGTTLKDVCGSIGSK